jgi:hypothetical protein
MAGTVKHARLESQSARESSAAASRIGRRWWRVRCISAGSVGRATLSGAGCCGATSAPTNIGCRPWDTC